MVSPTQNRILSHLTIPKTNKELESILGVPAGTIRGEISRLIKMGLVKKDTGKKHSLSDFGKNYIKKQKVQTALDEDTTRIFNMIKEQGNRYKNIFEPTEDIIFIDFMKLDKTSDLGEFLEDEPDIVFKAIWQYLHETDRIGEIDTPFIKVHNLPEQMKISIFEIRHEYIGKLVYFQGEIISHTQVRPYILTSWFTCARCGKEIWENSNDGLVPELLECKKEQGGCGRTARGTKFIEIKNKVIAKSIQHIKIEEQIRDQSNKPSIPIELSEPLIDPPDPEKRIYKDGNVVNVVGIVRTRRKVNKSGKKNMEFYVEAVNVEVITQGLAYIEPTPEQIKEIKKLSKKQEIFDEMVKCVCPVLVGYESLKGLVLLTMFYGDVNVLSDGTRVRKSPNILIIGNPSTGKSVLLRWLAGFYPKSAVSTGVGSSPAGLFGMPIRDELHGVKFTYISGLIPRCDGGIACVDEFEKHIAKYGESLFLEQMEHRQVSISKGDIRDLKLEADCPLICASNWRYDKFDNHRAPFEQLPEQISQLLISRCILVNVDTLASQIDRDRKLSRILEKHAGEIQIETETPISPDLLRAYISYARQNIHPIIDRVELNVYIKEVFENIATFINERENEGIRTIPISERYFEDLIRLTEASARIHLRTKPNITDVERAVKCLTLFLGEFARDRDGQFDIEILNIGVPRSISALRKGILEYIFVNSTESGILLDEILDTFSSEEEDRIKTVLDKLSEQADIKKMKKKGEIRYLVGR